VRTRAARTALAGWERVGANRPLLDACLPALLADAQAWPLDDQRWFRLGAARELAGDLAGAVEAYRRQVALDPSATTIAAYVTKLEERQRARPPGK
jgi:predicted TPR repeat methyltransferase